MLKLGNIAKFSLPEMFNDNTGKSSASAVIGVIVAFIGAISFAYCVIIKNLELGMQAVTVIGIGSSLLGVNKWMNTRTTESNDIKES